MDTVDLIGVRADGTQEKIGEAAMPPRMRAREIVASYFGHPKADGDGDSDADMCLAAMDDLLAWLRDNRLLLLADIAAGHAEPVAWRTPAAAWLRQLADQQRKTNAAYPEHVKCYPSWEKRVRDLEWLADDLEREQAAPATASAAAEQEDQVAQTSAEWERRFLAHAPSSDPAEAECDIPPHGWRCTRTKGHDGPCAAVAAPDDVALVRRSMARLAAAEQAEPVVGFRLLPSRLTNAMRAAMADAARAYMARTGGNSPDAMYDAAVAAAPPAPAAAEPTWPEWAEQILKTVREYSGYDGYDDADGVDLPEEVREALEELTAQIERLQAKAPAHGLLTDEQVAEFGALCVMNRRLKLTPQEMLAQYRADRGISAPSAAPSLGLADQWRSLAMRFDRHRMAAMSHLRTLLDNPEAHAAAARAFLDEPPPPAGTCQTCTAPSPDAFKDVADLAQFYPSDTECMPVAAGTVRRLLGEACWQPSRSQITGALVACPHVITDAKVILEVDQTEPGNALAQAVNRLTAAFAAGRAAT